MHKTTNTIAELPAFFHEDSEAVKALTQDKRRLRSIGLVSLYRLRNGWIARRKSPENRWSRAVNWTIYQNEDAFQNSRPIGSDEHRLTRALATVLNNLEAERRVA